MQRPDGQFVIVVFVAGLKIAQDQAPRGRVFAEAELGRFVGNAQFFHAGLRGNDVAERDAIVVGPGFDRQAPPGRCRLHRLHADRVVMVANRIRFPGDGVPGLVAGRAFRRLDAHRRPEHRRSFDRQTQVRPLQNRFASKRDPIRQLTARCLNRLSAQGRNRELQRAVRRLDHNGRLGRGDATCGEND